ncbi:ABC transporter ATP-binding protein [Streptomyces bacillaris]|uniref:ABC transporter ATP-binding protein n=1 Tax=Streptomyces bacillaris TaxID=68179 RepID=UPI003811D0ED
MFSSHSRPPAALDGRDLVLRYGKTPVVHGVSLSLEPGRATALVGPNGSGKSTLLRSLARLHRVDDGEVTLGGGRDEGGGGGGPRRAVSLLSAREFAREVTLFSQSRAAPQGLTVAEVVAFGRHPYRRGFAGLSADDRAAVAYAMDATRACVESSVVCPKGRPGGVRCVRSQGGGSPRYWMYRGDPDNAASVRAGHRRAGGTFDTRPRARDMADRPAGELSGGEMQRVWLAACLAQNTGVVLLDEPTNHLDLRYQIETLDLVRDLVEDHGIAVGVVLHDLDHAPRVADTLVLLRSGRVHAMGPPADVLTARNISEVYDIEVEAGVDPRSGRVRIDPVGRHPAPAAR